MLKAFYIPDLEFTRKPPIYTYNKETNKFENDLAEFGFEEVKNDPDWVRFNSEVGLNYNSMGARTGRMSSKKENTTDTPLKTFFVGEENNLFLRC